jgi:type IV pilus assembly protein PilM
MSIIGLDIGTTALRAVELTEGKKKKVNILRFHEIRLPQGAVSKGEIAQPEIVGPALKKLWSEGGFKSKNVALGTGNHRTLVRDLSVPMAPLAQIKESLPFHVQGSLQIPIESSLFDFYPVSHGQGELGLMVNGLLVTTEKQAILNNIHSVESSGLTPVEVDLIPFALSRLLISRSGISGTVALVDVGAGTTSIIVAKNGVPNFVRIIPAGGDDLTEALKTGLEIEDYKADLLKRTLRIGADLGARDGSISLAPECTCAKCQADLATVDDPRVQEILRSISMELLGSLRNTINYFNNISQDEPVSEILLCGGGTLLSGFEDALSEMIHVPVSTADALSSISFARKVNSDRWLAKGANFSVALGLALRSM